MDMYINQTKLGPCLKGQRAQNQTNYLDRQTCPRLNHRTRFGYHRMRYANLLHELEREQEHPNCRTRDCSNRLRSNLAHTTSTASWIAPDGLGGSASYFRMADGHSYRQETYASRVIIQKQSPLIRMQTRGPQDPIQTKIRYPTPAQQSLDPLDRGTERALGSPIRKFYIRK